jgi:hypothetical protein
MPPGSSAGLTSDDRAGAGGCTSTVYATVWTVTEDVAGEVTAIVAFVSIPCCQHSTCGSTCGSIALISSLTGAICVSRPRCLRPAAYAAYTTVTLQQQQQQQQRAAGWSAARAAVSCVPRSSQVARQGLGRCRKQCRQQAKPRELQCKRHGAARNAALRPRGLEHLGS